MEIESMGDFDRYFQSEEDCIRALFDMKWPDGFICPECARGKCSVISTRKLPLYECLHCHKQTSLISDTIFRGTRTPLLSWFRAIYFLSYPPISFWGTNARQLSKLIKVTYKTAWLMYHKIRNAMHQFDTNNLMTGLVRVNDETMYSHLRYKSENWHQVEQPIHVATSEDEMGNKQYLKIKVCPRLQAPVRSYATTTSGFLMKHVVPEARNTAIVNGGRFGIRRRTREMFNICYHAEKYLSGTYRGIGSKHLQVYLDEFTYIYNHKGNTIFNWLLRDCVTHQTITYPTLTCTPSRRSTKRSRSPEVAAKIG